MSCRETLKREIPRYLARAISPCLWAVPGCCCREQCGLEALGEAVASMQSRPQWLFCAGKRGLDTLAYKTAAY